MQDSLLASRASGRMFRTCDVQPRHQPAAARHQAPIRRNPWSDVHTLSPRRKPPVNCRFTYLHRQSGAGFGFELHGQHINYNERPLIDTVRRG